MSLSTVTAQQKLSAIWAVGKADELANEFALAPGGYKQFVAKDFGYEDKFYLIGHSKEKQDFPYVLPGPVDTWGGTWPTAGWRTNQVSILFALKGAPVSGRYKLVIRLKDFAKKFLPYIKVTVNNKDEYHQLSAEGYDVSKQPRPGLNEADVDTAALKGHAVNPTPKVIEIALSTGDLKKGGNKVIITVLRGSWIMFDQVALNGPVQTTVQKPGKFFIEDVKPAPYELTENGRKSQPLIVSVQHINGRPKINVRLDGKSIFSQLAESGAYEFEALMPAVNSVKLSTYQILEDGRLVSEGIVKRSPGKLQALADYVDTRLGTAHSRWMIAPGPWMPFSMVKMSPDNQSPGWQAGYDPSFESIGTFSHIHEWTMAGLGVFATNGPLKTSVGTEMKSGSGYRSAINKRTEEAPIGYYKADLEDYNIKAEVTATTRCGFERFTFPKDRDSARILLDLHIPAEYDYQLKDVSVKKVSANRIEGYARQYEKEVWGGDAYQDYTIYFVVEFDQPIQNIGNWINKNINYKESLSAKDIQDAGLFVQFDASKNPVVQVRSAISLVSLDNAKQSLSAEISTPFGWNFNAVRAHQLDTWNAIFNRVRISTSNRLEKMRFYNALYRSICSRSTWSDLNGEWRSTDGKIRKLKGKDDVALGCDAFWNTFWNLNQVWNLVTPEWSKRWVNSQLAMYDANGWLAKGPAGMNYIPVMVAEHEIPFIVSAYQMGIRDFDADKALKAAVKMQTTPSQKVFSGYAGNRDLLPYLKHHYVPSDSGRFSNSMEYSYDDWTVGQLARSLGNQDLFNQFNERGYWWRNAIDTAGYCHMKLSNGNWVGNFDPFKTGANEHYVEGNAWQLTFFVPQDVPALVKMIGKERFVDRLEWGFKQSEPWRYNGMNDQYWDYPVVQGNQQSMHFAFLFNWAGKPWSTQKWSRSILDRFYGYKPGNAYLGDEDQGQMSAWLVMTTMGLFQTDGGAGSQPVYEIGSPLFQKVVIDLGEQFGRGKTFTIIAKNSSRKNLYVQSAVLNGRPLNAFYFPAGELLKGGSLVLEMGDKPNEKWGVD
ncbi:GH92 family glycosyl hydrolase [Mucilaginibacter limnophilus]|nr:GH92 family glycosyl hydrolase [Mucilaginibacter limnophilus]